ncbi:MAG: L-histidine N(alpha)-methyltransferase [Balneolaceae bacterium]|nr:L-histidine N(alpha)-methyltransferase [Balneolaceae bacterium]
MEAILGEKKISEEMLTDVLKGLQKTQKTLPSKYFYDNRGSQLFDEICQLDEYYLTRTELNIMQKNIRDISEKLGKNIQLVELGSGSSLKTRLLLDHLEDLYSYVPVDISKTFLDDVADILRAEYPNLQIQPLAADYTQPIELPKIPDEADRIIYFPGSTIGNFTKEDAEDFIGLIADSLDEHGGLLVGFDLVKDRETLLAAYDDSEGVTAQFNKNVLQRINKELDGNFDLNRFEHKAIFNEKKSRIEMHLVSTVEQTVKIAGEEIHFEEGETIHTENSHKYTLSSFRNMTEPHFKNVHTWTDSNEYFAVQYLCN